jgi:hypothetical protein
VSFQTRVECMSEFFNETFDKHVAKMKEKEARRASMSAGEVPPPASQVGQL